MSQQNRASAQSFNMPLTQDSPEKNAADENFWHAVATQFELDPSFTNLENGYYGVMPQPVLAHYTQNTVRLNRSNSYFLRTSHKKELEGIRAQLADALGVATAEIAFTQGGTEALQNLIAGYNRLEPGDAVLYADLDYYSCQYAIKWLAERRKVSLIKIAIPEPIDWQSAIDCYEQAFNANPNVKLVLLSHVNNRTGLVLPVKEICSLARTRGVDVIVDAAHSWGQLNFQLNDLAADFVGLSLHKWIHAPLGLGCMYIKKDRITDIDSCFADELYAADDIRARVHSGTINVAPALTLPTALDFHHKIGAQRKELRLRYLRNSWVNEVKGWPGMQILTPDDSRMTCGITSFRVSDRSCDEIVHKLFAEHGIFTVKRGGIAKGECIRVTPALFTASTDIEHFVRALYSVL